MKNKIKFLPIVVCLILLIVGIIFLVSTPKIDLFTTKGFLSISLIIVGVVGSITSFFIVKFAKSFDQYKVKPDDEYSSIANYVHQKIQEFSETATTQQEETREKPHKKITCHYCKCKYDSSLSRCPSCGAPPEGDF